MNYFKGCTNREDAKDRFRGLSKKLHPDHGGKASDFVEMNKQYENLNFSSTQHEWASNFNWKQFYERNEKARYESDSDSLKRKYEQLERDNENIYDMYMTKMRELEKCKADLQEVEDEKKKINIAYFESVEELNNLHFFSKFIFTVCLIQMLIIVYFISRLFI